MASRKTENRLPGGLQAADLGQALSAADGRCTLVSYATEPLTTGRSNTYVLFITDAALGAAAASFEWTFAESGAPPPQTTAAGTVTYAPAQSGSLQTGVRVLDGGGGELAALSMTQQVAAPNAALEALLSEATDSPGPGMGSPEVLRELVNDHNRYYQGVTPIRTESGDAYQRFVYLMVYDGVCRRSPDARSRGLAQLAAALNEGQGDFAALSATESGVGGIRLPLLAMSLPALLPWTLLPAEPPQRASAAAALQQSLAALDDDTLVDLFNIVRFPKSNITHCGRIIETLCDHYFPGTTFGDVLSGLSGTRAQWIIAQYRQGPVAHS